MAVDQPQDISRAICSTRRGSPSSRSVAHRQSRLQFDFSRTRDLPPDQMTLGESLRLEFSSRDSLVPDAVDRLTQKKSTHSSEKRKPPQQNREAETPTEVNSGFLILEEEEEPGLHKIIALL